MINEGFVKSIVSEVKADLFEGGAGSGNWGHKGRPGMRGGSLGGGGKAGGAGGKGGVFAHPRGKRADRDILGSARDKGLRPTHIPVIVKGLQKRGYKNVAPGEFVKKGSKGKLTKKGYLPSGFKWSSTKKAGSGISAHKITVGGQKLHGRDYYNAAGKLDAANYSKLSGANKTQVLKHGIQKYTESYVPKAQQGKLGANGLSANKKIGALEGMRRAAVTKAKSSTGKESRAAMHVAISLQVRANEVIGQLKASGGKAVGAATGAGSKVVGAGLTAARIAGRPVGR